MLRVLFAAVALGIVAPAIVCLGLPLGPQGGATIRVDPRVRYQRMVGWEGTCWIGQGAANFQEWREEVLDLAVNDLGLNRLRLEVPAGIEHDVDVFEMLDEVGEGEGNCLRYSTVNDNADPNVINPAGFQFSDFDKRMEQIVLPVRALLAARGETLHLNICYVAFAGVLSRPPCAGNLQYGHKNPAEYAEFVLAVNRHLRDKYGVEADTWELLLEPDSNSTAGWTGTELGQVLVAAGQRLRADGFSTTFVLPSAKILANAITMFDEIAAVPGALDYVSELSYHRYGGAIESKLTDLANRAREHGFATAMLEHIGSGYEDLHQDLEVGMNSSWSQYTICGPAPGDPGGRYYLIDANAPPGSQIRIASRTPFLRQYFRYVRKGAVRVGASSTASSLDPLAFESPDGRYAVVVKADAAASFTVEGVPPGTYGITFATTSEPNGALADVAVAAGQPLTASIPARGVVTIFSKTLTETRPRVTSCEVKRTSSGASVVVVRGENFREGATATVGGVVPKKIKMKGEVSPGQGVYTQLVLKGGVCRGLPGDVVVTNPGAGSSDPFPCTGACR